MSHGGCQSHPVRMYVLKARTAPLPMLSQQGEYATVRGSMGPQHDVNLKFCAYGQAKLRRPAHLANSNRTKHTACKYVTTAVRISTLFQRHSYRYYPTTGYAKRDLPCKCRALYLISSRIPCECIHAYQCFKLESLRLYEALLSEQETDMHMLSRLAYPVVG